VRAPELAHRAGPSRVLRKYVRALLVFATRPHKGCNMPDAVLVVNSLLVAACMQNVVRHYYDMWVFVYSTACTDGETRAGGGVLLNHLCQHYARLSDFTSIENFVTTIVHLNYHLIIVM
jgi:hypothetical protein